MKLILRLLSILIVSLILVAQPVSAARPDAPKYALRGPFPVGTRELKLANGPRSLDATVWYPALNPDKKKEEVVYRYGLLTGTGQALLNADVDASKGPYPLIVFSHGLGGLRYQLVSYTEQLASYGFVVIAADHPGSTFNDMLSASPTEGILTSFARRPLEVLQEISYFEGLKEDALGKAVDLTRVGVTGHSFGGYTTLAAGGAQFDTRPMQAACAGKTNDMECAFVPRLNDLAKARGLTAVPIGLWPATTDPRIKAIAPLAPSSGIYFGKEGLSAIKIPMLIMVGTKDESTPPAENAIPAYQNASSAQKGLALFENANHYIFVERCPAAAIALGRYTQCSDAVWDMDRAHDLINHLGTAFFLATLKNDADAAKALLPNAVSFVGVKYDTTLKP